MQQIRSGQVVSNLPKMLLTSRCRAYCQHVTALIIFSSPCMHAFRWCKRSLSPSDQDRMVLSLPFSPSWAMVLPLRSIGGTPSADRGSHQSRRTEVRLACVISMCVLRSRLGQGGSPDSCAIDCTTRLGSQVCKVLTSAVSRWQKLS